MPPGWRATLITPTETLVFDSPLALLEWLERDTLAHTGERPDLP